MPRDFIGYGKGHGGLITGRRKVRGGVLANQTDQFDGNRRTGGGGTWGEQGATKKTYEK